MIERVSADEVGGATAASLVLHLGWLLLLLACGIAFASELAAGASQAALESIALGGACWITSLTACLTSIRRLERHALALVRARLDEPGLDDAPILARGERRRQAERARRFLGELSILREELGAAAEDLDLAGLAWWAHRLADAGSDLGALSLRDVALRLEESARAGDPARADKALVGLDWALARLSATLERELVEDDPQRAPKQTRSP